MKRLGVHTLLVVAAILGAVSCMSCGHQATTASTPPATKFIKPTPEESLSFIMDTFRRRMEETPIGFVIADSNGRSTMTGTNKVSYELVRPADGSENFRALVTVKSESHYSMKRTKDSSDDKSDEQNKQASALPPEEGQEGSESCDSSVAIKQTPDATDSSSRREEDARRPQQQTRTYELDYKEGRWKLVTELNPETESSIKNAFQNALDTQG
jgi:hypothetical protein